jgi:hypothetical protein
MFELGADVELLQQQFVQISAKQPVEPKLN